MAWPLTPLTTYVANSTPVIKAADLNSIQTAINNIFGGSLSLKQMLLDGTGAATTSLTAGIVAQITGGALQLDGASGDTNAELVSSQVPSNRKLLWKISNSYCNTYVYAPLQDNISKIGGLEIVTNASWNGSQWVRDTATQAAAKLVVNRNGFYLYVYTGSTSPFADNAWTGQAQIQSDGSYYTNTGNVSGLLLNGTHLVCTSGTPTKAVGAAAGTGGAVSVVGTDIDGQVIVTTGTSGMTTGTLATVTFATAFASTPYVTLTPANIYSASDGYNKVYVSSNLTTFSLNAQAALSNASQSYTWNYHVMG